MYHNRMQIGIQSPNTEISNRSVKIMGKLVFHLFRRSLNHCNHIFMMLFSNIFTSTIYLFIEVLLYHINVCRWKFTPTLPIPQEETACDIILVRSRWVYPVMIQAEPWFCPLFIIHVFFQVFRNHMLSLTILAERKSRFLYPYV